ncbi:glycosyltransferase [Entomospira culicis]|uniref:Glycosyltransferase family 4 protein n=1 Tax=Entomospira culicis TaxID=2719989 RepID=A0A968KX82_9SPIO|nr:glycosyltransferase [Entomospira culicis]NIZ19858.1 glycosyltransferase family 4 protein [Entomospira culicis]NIZ70072.1 glycosyltransferase family 4 protein [Entomospira culicis]WDI37176.1 glycosyltransferase [Entomospira culicis]WDI38805.1 glycosyltransferase [Entomospira culicis]
MKIAVTTDAFYPRTHGIAVAIDSSIRYLAQAGHEVAVYAPSFPDTKEREYPKGITIHRFDSYSIADLKLTTNKEERFVYKREFPRIRQLLADFNPDVIYNHMEFTIGSVTKAWALEHNTPTIMMVHTYFPPYFKIYAPFFPLALWRSIIKHWSRWFYKGFDLLVTPSKEMKQVIQEVYKIEQPIEVLPTGIIVENFAGVDQGHERESSFIYKEHPRVKTRRRLLFVGRVGKEKNVRFLLKMMEKLLQQREDVELLIAGSGSYMEQHKALVKRMGIDGHVTFLGAFPNSQMKYVYAIADIFVFASLTETQGVVTTEALCNGIPVVAIAELGSISVLEGERGGFLVENDLDAFANKVNLLLDDEALYAKKRQEAQARGKELAFDVLTGEKLVRLLTQVVVDKRSMRTEATVVSSEFNEEQSMNT